MNGDEIFKRQNSQKGIQMLAAQREIYFVAKKLRGVQFHLSTSGVVFLAALGFLNGFLLNSLELSIAIAIISTLILVTNFILEGRISHLKEFAARVQEGFDTWVLDIAPNILVKPVAPEDIHKFHDKHKARVSGEAYAKLSNWYSEKITNCTSRVATIICQRSNFYFDESLRNKFGNRNILILGIILALIIATGALLFMWVKPAILLFLLSFVMPSIPVLMVLLKQFLKNRKPLPPLPNLKIKPRKFWD